MDSSFITGAVPHGMVHRITPDRAVGRAHCADSPPVLPEQTRALAMDFHLDCRSGYICYPVSSSQWLTGFCSLTRGSDVLIIGYHYTLCNRDRNCQENFLRSRGNQFMKRLWYCDK